MPGDLRKSGSPFPHRGLKHFLPWIILFTAAVGVYANTLTHDFVWDDIALILEDHTVKSLQYIGQIFSSDFFGHHEDDLVYGYFRPMVSLSYLIDYALWQQNPMGYHLTNILLHGGATLLVAYLLLLMRFTRASAFGAALLFAVHPMHTENTAWISGRTDLIAFVLSASAFALHLRARQSSRGVLLKAVGLLFFAGALFAKEMAVVLIPWLVIENHFMNRRPMVQSLVSALPHTAVLLLYLVWRFGVVDVSVPFQSTNITLWDRLIAAPYTVVRYLAWLVAPIRQSAYVQNPFIEGLGDIRLYVGLFGLGGLTYLFLRLRKGHPLVAGSALMLGVSFAPILNIVAVSAPADMGNAMAERFLYFPSFPLLALLSLGAEAAWRRVGENTRRRRGLAAAAFLAVTALAVATIHRNRVWKNNEVFYQTTLASTPSALLWCNLANHYIHQGRIADAEEALSEAKRFFADDYHYLAVQASWFVAQKRYKEAIALQRKVAGEVNRGRAVAYNNLAFLYRATGELDKAEALLQEIIDNKRAYGDVYFNLGAVHEARGEFEKARQRYREALRQRPDSIRYAGALGGLLLRNGAYDAAEKVYRTQLSMHRNNPGLMNNLGLVYKNQGAPNKAIAMFESALREDPAYAKARLNLAAALFSVKRSREAVAALRQIIDTQPTTAEAAKAAELLKSLDAGN